MQYPDNNKSEDSGKNINEDSIGVRNAGPQLRIDIGNRIKKQEAEMFDLGQLPQSGKK